MDDEAGDDGSRRQAPPRSKRAATHALTASWRSSVACRSRAIDSHARRACRPTSHPRINPPRTTTPKTRIASRGRDRVTVTSWPGLPALEPMFGGPATRFHAHLVETLAVLRGVDARADNHRILAGAPRHARLLHAGVTVPPEVSYVRARLAVAVGGACAAREHHRTEDEGHESGHGWSPSARGSRIRDAPHEPFTATSGGSTGGSSSRAQAPRPPAPRARPLLEQARPRRAPVRPPRASRRSRPPRSRRRPRG
jgi:hypothetical protein